MVRPRELHGRRRRAAWIRARNPSDPAGGNPKAGRQGTKQEDQAGDAYFAAAADRCASSKENTDIRFPRDGNAGRNRGTVRVAAFDAIADSQSRSAAILRREVLRRVLGPARKS